MSRDKNLNTCEHKRTTSEDGAIHCVYCGDRLLTVQQYYTQSIDLLTASLSAVLWDFHDRAVEKYGPLVVGQVPAEGCTTEEDTEVVDCEGQHVWSGENCANCGESKFLG